MSAGARIALPLVALIAAGCAPLPPATTSGEAPSPAVRSDPPQRSPRTAFATRQADLARRATEAGDLATAEDHWQVLVMLEPDNAAYRAALDATREAIVRAVRDHYQTGVAARRNGDTSRARDAFLRVLALDASHADAARTLREIEQQAMSRTQGERAARARAADDIIAGARARAAASPASPANAADAYDLEQRLELVRGDVQAGVRELRAWVDANPGDRTGRLRAGTAVAERAREIDGKGQREAALALYEQAASLAGAAQPEWTTRMQALRKALGEQYYAEGMKLYRTDLGGAIRQWEAGAKFDPGNATLQMRLREAKLAQQKLQKIGEKQ